MLCPAKKISYLRKRRAEQRAAVGKQACSFARASFRAAGHAHSRCCSCSLGGTAAAAGAACGPQASRLLVATGSLSARRDQLRSCGAAAMLARAPPGPPPGDGLSARRWHTGLGASAPLLVRQTSCAGTAACNALAHCTCRSSKLRCVRSGGLEPNAYTLLSRSYSQPPPVSSESREREGAEGTGVA